jgi:acid phosphatase family membrane protein YuiD
LIVRCGADGTPFGSAAFWSGVLGWTVASILKILVNWLRTRRVDFHYLTSLGGMPSAHSAMVSALATSVGRSEGFGSTIFVIALVFAMIVMFDASTVRRAAGLQARLLNQIVEEIRKERHVPTQKLKEILGHTRMEVFAGMLVGVAVGLIVTLLMN